ncbi:MAG: T9SS type A sorting domain-containing protein [Flavobacteriales bacterium]|nr:MAG: T9SS type A sorting domain-containing protein [Flavobacteriales bacterium]
MNVLHHKARTRAMAGLVGFTFFGFTQAQITITQADMPSAGDIPARWNTTVTQFDDADTGPNHVWDFSVLQPQLETADTCVSVSSTPILYQFFFNNPFIYPDHDADYAVRGQDFDFQVLQLTDVYDYFKRDANGFDNVGFGANINGVPASVQRLPVDHVYELPLNYSDASTSPSTWEVEVPGVLFFRQEQVRDNTVDGWGTLYLPTDTFQVLRVKSVLNRTDSIYVDQFMFGFSLPEPETIEYKWLAAGMDVPVLQVNTVAGIATTVRFWYDSTSLGLNGPEAIGAFHLFPNPADHHVQVLFVAGEDRSLEVLDLSGRTVITLPLTSARTSADIDVRALANGLYTVRLSGTDRTARLVVKH